MLACGLKTETPAFPSGVFFQVPFRYWYTPEAVEVLFLASHLYPDSHLAIARGNLGSILYAFEYEMISSFISSLDRINGLGGGVLMGVLTMGAGALARDGCTPSPSGKIQIIR